jgi:ribonuclease D
MRMPLSEQTVADPEELARCCEQLASCQRLGFDTEFVGEDTYHPHLCLVQVATDDRLILIDPLSAGPLDAFWKLIVDPKRQIIVHAGREEVRLCAVWTGSTPGNMFDLQIAAGLVGLNYPLGHGALVKEVLGIQIGKGETLTEWRTRPLTPAQIRYAFDDVRYLLPLETRLSKRLAELDRLQWATEEFGRLTAQAAPDDAGVMGSVEKWRKLKSLGSLDRRQLAIVREIYAWREATAARTNRPPRSLCRDDLIVEIARRNPRRPHDLQVIRGLPRRDIDAILSAVERARQLPLEQCPRTVEREWDRPQVSLISNVLSAVLGDVCVRRHLAANLVATSQDIKLLIRSRLQPQKPTTDVAPESLLTQGWRQRHILPEILAVLDGRRSVRIADVHADAPFAYYENAP